MWSRCWFLSLFFSLKIKKKREKEERRAEKIFGEKSSPSQRGFCVSYERIYEFKLSSFF